MNSGTTRRRRPVSTLRCLLDVTPKVHDRVGRRPGVAFARGRKRHHAQNRHPVDVFTINRIVPIEHLLVGSEQDGLVTVTGGQHRIEVLTNARFLLLFGVNVEIGLFELELM